MLLTLHIPYEGYLHIYYDQNVHYNTQLISISLMCSDSEPYTHTYTHILFRETLKKNKQHILIIFRFWKLQFPSFSLVTVSAFVYPYTDTLPLLMVLTPAAAICSVLLLLFVFFCCCQKTAKKYVTTLSLFMDCLDLHPIPVLISSILLREILNHEPAMYPGGTEMSREQMPLYINCTEVTHLYTNGSYQLVYQNSTPMFVCTKQVFSYGDI